MQRAGYGIKYEICYNTQLVLKAEADHARSLPAELPRRSAAGFFGTTGGPAFFVGEILATSEGEVFAAGGATSSIVSICPESGLRSKGWVAFAGTAGFGLLASGGGGGAPLPIVWAFPSRPPAPPLLFFAGVSGATGDISPAGDGPLISSEGRGCGLGIGFESGKVGARGGRGGAGFDVPFRLPFREFVGEVMSMKSPVEAGVSMGDPDGAGEGDRMAIPLLEGIGGGARLPGFVCTRDDIDVADGVRPGMGGAGLRAIAKPEAGSGFLVDDDGRAGKAGASAGKERKESLDT